MGKIRGKYNGVLLCLFMAFLSMILGEKFKLIGSSVFAVVIGILYRNIIEVDEKLQKSLKPIGKYFLQYSIIALGFTFSFAKITRTGGSSLSISIVTILLSFLTALFIGKKLSLSSKLSTLIGFGTAICGGSAIAAASPIVEADEQEIALSISTIFLFNIVAVFVFPFLGRLMGMDNQMFGIWAGTAINDTSSVVAAGYSYSQEAGDIATIVKLARALMIVPSCFIMAGIKIYKDKKSEQKINVLKIVPWFILWFLSASALSSLGVIPKEILPIAKKISQVLMAMALFAIGTQVSFEEFKKAGLKPILTGAGAWFVVAVTSLIMQKLLYR